METQATNDITPFWLRMPKFFLYPTDLTALMFIAILSFFTLSIKVAILVGASLYFIAFLFFFKYAYSVLEWTAKGHLEPPSVSMDTIAPTNLVVFKQLFVIVLMAVAVGYVAKISTAAAIILSLFFLFALPASIMTMAYQESMIAAINPLALLTLITSIGAPYIIFYIFILLLFSSLGAVSWGVVQFTDSLFIQNFVFMYFMLIIFNMMGYIMYQYHQELGVSVIQEDQYATPAEQQNAAVDNEVTTLINDGNIKQAIAVMQDQLKSPVVTTDMYDRYHKLLILADNARLATKNGRQYINILIYNEKNLRRAVDIFKDCQQLDPEFEMADPDQIYDLANTARQMRDFDTAIAIIGRFQENHPKHRDIPCTYLMAAKMLCEEMNNDTKARKILHFLVKKFPNHELTSEIQEYATMVDKLTAM